MKGVLQTTGCCRKYRAEIVLRPPGGGVISVTAFGGTKELARAEAYKLAGETIRGFDRQEVKER